MQRWNLADWARMGKALGLNNNTHHGAEVNEPAAGSAAAEKGVRRTSHKRRAKKRE